MDTIIIALTGGRLNRDINSRKNLDFWVKVYCEMIPEMRVNELMLM